MAQVDRPHAPADAFYAVATWFDTFGAWDFPWVERQRFQVWKPYPADGIFTVWEVPRQVAYLFLGMAKAEGLRVSNLGLVAADPPESSGYE